MTQLTMQTEPVWPAQGTDSRRMLDALMAAHPEPFWQPNSRLELTAHSRVSDLRSMGWAIDAVNKARPEGGRKRLHGYVLRTPNEVAA